MVDVILGLQWGDEGKGKIVDLLAKELHISKEQVLYDNDNTAFLIPMEDLYETK